MGQQNLKERFTERVTRIVLLESPKCNFAAVNEHYLVSLKKLRSYSRSGLHREAKRRDPRRGDRGVWLGVNPPHSHHR